MGATWNSGNAFNARRHKHRVLLKHLLEMPQQEHIDSMERLRWHAFKYAYRKSHPTEIRDSKYYANVRKAYNNQGTHTLSTWLVRKPSKVLQRNKNE